MDKAIYFDNMGKPHEASIVLIHKDNSANLRYHIGEFKRLWRMDKIHSESWKLIDNVSPKDLNGELIAEQVIEINEDGTKTVRGIKNCYKVISD